MGYEDRAGHTVEYTPGINGEAPAYPVVISSTSNPRHYLPMTVDDARWVASLIDDIPQPVDPDRMPVAAWPDHPHIAMIGKAVLMTGDWRTLDDLDRWAAEFVVNLAKLELAVVTCGDRGAAHQGVTVVDYDRRRLARDLRSVADCLDIDADREPPS